MHASNYVPYATSLATHITLEWYSADYSAVATNFGDEILRELNPISTAGSLARDTGKPTVLQTPGILRYLARTYPDAMVGGSGSVEEDARNCRNIYAFYERMRADPTVEKVLRDEETW